MPSYIVTAYCETCSVNHLTGTELAGTNSTKQSIAEVFDGTFLPPEIAMMSRKYFLCPQTGKINKRTDSKKTFQRVGHRVLTLGAFACSGPLLQDAFTNCLHSPAAP